MKPEIVFGDLLDQDVETIINSWNRNIIPWWLLLPQGVSGAIKKRGGCQPFIEVAKYGPIPLGGAVMTSAGRLPFRSIIHVAGINMFWRSSVASIQNSVLNAVELMNHHGISTAAFPLVGAGAGGMSEEKALNAMLSAFDQVDTHASIIIVRHCR